MRRLSLAIFATLSASAAAFLAWMVWEVKHIDPKIDSLDYSEPQNW